MGNIANVTNFTVYKEGDGISFQTLYETASQGPCPSGFHIPTKDEMQYVFDTLKTLEGGTVTAQNLQDHLFLPPVGYIDRQTGQQSTSYGVIRVWTCTFSGAQCYAFKDDTGGVGLSLDRPATGMQIRPFANQPIVPDSSWTTPITIGTASLSVNHTLGLISITADGEKYITLSDKNLGATAYYNGTVAAANTGHYYQAGNNYGFDTPITNTSDTKVDTTGYGPGNYYNSDTYICGSSISDWRTKSNDNLWGGVGIAKGVSINVVRDSEKPKTHVPTKQEWDDIITVWGDENWGDADFYKKLHIPLTGQRVYATDMQGVGTSVGLWTRTYQGEFYETYITDSSYMTSTQSSCVGNFVRMFMDEYVAPDSTWTVEKGTLNGAGVFYNATLGIISITNGTDISISIRDKNVGATVAWNYGDSGSISNIGYVFQWGNCYGFSGMAGTEIYNTDTNTRDAEGFGHYTPFYNDVFVEGYDWMSRIITYLWDKVTEDKFVW